MQAIGSEVILALTPLIILLSVTIYYLFPKIKDYVANMRRPAQVREDPVEVHPRFGQGACSICLQPKRYEVSATCGHSFCGRCIIQLYERWNDRIQCPLCRRVMTTMFRGFDERYGQQRQRTRIMNQIHGYNQRFDDNRPLWRRIRELPTVLRRLRPIIMSPYFIILFIRSIYFLRFLFFFIFYLLVPYDILPQSVLGAIGFLDDIFIGIFILLFVFTTFGLLFIRGRH